MAFKNRLKQKKTRMREEYQDAARNGELLQNLRTWCKMVHENLDEDGLRDLMKKLSGKPSKMAKITQEKLFEAMKSYTMS